MRAAAPLVAHDRSHGDHMVGIGGVAHTEDQSEDCDAGGCGIIGNSHHRAATKSRLARKAVASRKNRISRSAQANRKSNEPASQEFGN
jgi:hypothetical protein